MRRGIFHIFVTVEGFAKHDKIVPEVQVYLPAVVFGSVPPPI